MTITRVGHRYIDVASGKTIDTWYPRANKQIARSCLAQKVGLIKSDFVETEIDVTTAPTSTEDVYLRLHLLSECVVKPHEINLEGMFGMLPNIAWTSAGPVMPGSIEELRGLIAEEHVQLNVTSVDKFPRMTDYVMPEGVRIADADRVRLGAHLASGTTVMHEGFVNFNAGTLGESMVEGRISAGVLVGANSDVGGGASTMGTLSGGGKQVISIGERCLLGAESGLGIPLGDECIIEAGLYLTAGTKVKTPEGELVSARDLAGKSGLLYRRNSVTGAVEAITINSDLWGGLNDELHSND